MEYIYKNVSAIFKRKIAATWRLLTMLQLSGPHWNDLKWIFIKNYFSGIYFSPFLMFNTVKNICAHTRFLLWHTEMEKSNLVLVLFFGPVECICACARFVVHEYAYKCTSLCVRMCVDVMKQRIACGNMIMDFYDSFHFRLNVCCVCVCCLNAKTTLNVNQLSLKRTDSLRKWDFWCSNSFNRLFGFSDIIPLVCLCTQTHTHIQLIHI